MNNEALSGIPQKKPEQKEEERRVNVRADESAWGDEERIAHLGEEYKAVQMQRIKLEADLSRSIDGSTDETKAENKSPALSKLAILVRQGMQKEIDAKKSEEQRARASISLARGNPDDYLVQ